jgi:hypothetical protein
VIGEVGAELAFVEADHCSIWEFSARGVIEWRVIEREAVELAVMLNDSAPWLLLCFD